MKLYSFSFTNLSDMNNNHDSCQDSDKWGADLAALSDYAQNGVALSLSFLFSSSASQEFRGSCWFAVRQPFIPIFWSDQYPERQSIYLDFLHGWYSSNRSYKRGHQYRIPYCNLRAQAQRHNNYSHVVVEQYEIDFDHRCDSIHVNNRYRVWAICWEFSSVFDCEI